MEDGESILGSGEVRRAAMILIAVVMGLLSGPCGDGGPGSEAFSYQLVAGNNPSDYSGSCTQTSTDSNLAVVPSRADNVRVEEPSCAHQPGLVGPCFTVHGRLSLYNGTPSARIWKVGTNRILGVTESRCVAPDCPQMPDKLRKMLSWDRGIFGDFLVCPFTKEMPGHMQSVCVESAKHLHVRSLR